MRRLSVKPKLRGHIRQSRFQTGGVCIAGMPGQRNVQVVKYSGARHKYFARTAFFGRRAVKLDRAADYNTGGPLFGLRKTTMDQTTQNGFDEGSDSDGDYDASGNYLAIPLTTGNPGDNNHNYDFGFVLAPSAAPVSVTGRITTANGNGIRNVRVVLTEENGTMHNAITGSFGYFVFENIESGQGVVVSVSAKRYTFSQPSRFISLEDNISDADWVSEQ